MGVVVDVEARHVRGWPAALTGLVGHAQVKREP